MIVDLAHYLAGIILLAVALGGAAYFGRQAVDDWRVDRLLGATDVLLAAVMALGIVGFVLTYR
jgi:hypothetical protein